MADDAHRIAGRLLPGPRIIIIPGPLEASASNTQCGSRMREFRPYGSVPEGSNRRSCTRFVKHVIDRLEKRSYPKQ
ncbi:MAG: hypothetical protein QOF70_4728 [Acetobacteraceae bacterium]|jgi:hypothetical protein|nr:hypothetical protein [Acetobacteraceae bacterium]